MIDQTPVLEKYQEVVDKIKNLEKSHCGNEMVRLEGALQVLKELIEASQERAERATTVEENIKTLMTIIYLGNEFKKTKKDRALWWRTHAKVSNREYKLIGGMFSLLFGDDSELNHQQIVNSATMHAMNLVKNSATKIEGLSCSYSDIIGLMKKIEKSHCFSKNKEKETSIVRFWEPQVSFDHEDLGSINLSTNIENHRFTITVKCNDEKLYKFGIDECFGKRFLSCKKYQITLEDYLNSSSLLQRRQVRFGSKVLYPTTYVKGLIQGLLTAVIDLIDAKKNNGFLFHCGNILLHEAVFYPYPHSYLSAPNLVKSSKKCVSDANECRQYTVPVSFVNRVSSEQPMDDLDAIYMVIFEKILEVKGNPLPPDWILFQKSFASKRSPIFSVILSSNSVLWDWQDKLDLLVYACHLYFDSTYDMQSWVEYYLKNMDILKEDWGSVFKAEKSWENVWSHGRKEGKPYQNDEIDSVLKCFRNLVVHVDKQEMEYGNKSYLEHKLSYHFPYLFQQINEELIKLGIKY